MDDKIRQLIEKDRKELSGNFCRGCGYCMPCPQDIEINNCARMSLLLRRSPSKLQLTADVQAKMKKIEDCIHCGQCAQRCPYGLGHSGAAGGKLQRLSGGPERKGDLMWLRL